MALGVFMFAWLLGHQLQQSLIQHRRHPNWLVAGLSSIAALAVLLAGFKYGGETLAAMGQSPATITMAQSAFMSLFATLIAPALFRLFRLSAPPS